MINTTRERENVDPFPRCEKMMSKIRAIPMYQHMRVKIHLYKTIYTSLRVYTRRVRYIDSNFNYATPLAPWDSARAHVIPGVRAVCVCSILSLALLLTQKTCSHNNVSAHMKITARIWVYIQLCEARINSADWILNRISLFLFLKWLYVYA